MRTFSKTLVLWTAVFTAGAGNVAAAQTNPIDDVIKLAIDAWNDFRFTSADSIARRVLTMQSATNEQKTRAQMVIAAAAFPEDAAAQRRPAALAALKEVVRFNMNATLPPELTWAGLEALMEEARRTTFALGVTAERQQFAVGPEGMAKIHVKANKPGLFRLVIMATNGGAVAVVDSLVRVAEGDITFRTMRNERPIFTSGDYDITITGFEPGGRGDTVVVRYGVRVDAPALTFVTPPSRMDSSALLPERTGRFGAKSVLPALIAGGAAFAFSSTLRGGGEIATEVGGDAKGVAIGGAIAAGAILAGYSDKGRPIPENVAANVAAGEAFQKSIADTQTENRRRIAEYRTTLTFNLEPR